MAIAIPSNATLIILIISLITTLLWLLSYPDISVIFSQPLRYSSQLIGDLTLVFMAISLVVSMRMRIIDKIFRGLDKSYKFHALIGSIAFLFMIAHPLMLLINILPDTKSAARFVIPGPYLAANFALAAIYIAIFAFTFMSFIKIKYNFWLNTHRLLAISFLLASVHAILAPSNILRNTSLTAWLALWTFLGLTAAVFSIILYHKFGAKYSYTISQIERLGDVLQISLAPNQDQLQYLPGQFVYVRFHNPHLGNEMHPFSPSSAREEKTLRISVKILGDYTKEMASVLKVGEKSEVYGPFGSFYSEYTDGKSDLIWIGGGIGVTPFLSMLHTEALKNSNKKILFYYSVNKPEEAIFDPELIEVQKLVANVNYVKWVADLQGFLTMEKIIEKSKQLGLIEPIILLCGPPPMMNALTTQASKLNIEKKRIIFEQFSFLP